MSLMLKMWITVSTECLTENALGSGINLMWNPRDLCKRDCGNIRKINILKPRNGCQVETRKNGEIS